MYQKSIKEGDMADPKPQHGAPEENEERVPVFQQILDNPFLLLFLGVTIPTVLYILWGVMEIATVPVSPLAK
jgi:hypothetical protein